ncbi:MAG: InlB B-repeat-containing protein, partial [Candidatus Bathyarchaeota archaeon]|nr:InlB B-repeat-containing protein [Candidatus Termiticorpusculum sp.]
MALIVVLLTMIFLPLQESTAAPITDTPTGVTGRILPASLAGDTSDWIEIARNGDYSLIVRANYIKIGRDSNPSYPYSPAQPNIYSTSNVRAYINKWFNNLLTPIVAGNAYDSLPDNARLRDFTVQNNAATVVGTSYQINSYTDGFSKPTTYQLRYGNDIAFALSYSEVIAYLSLYDYKMGPILTHSNSIAKANFGKLGVSDGYIYLRSTPYSNWARPALMMNPTSGTYAGVTEVMFDGYFVPALWVGSGIFEPVSPSYNINYVLDGGVNAVNNPSSYTVNTLPVFIANPTKTGYNFQYWTMRCANGTIVQLPNSGIPVGTTGDVVLTAIWQEIVRYGTIIITHIDSTDWSVLNTTTRVVPAGSYGPYGPESFPGYNTGTLVPGSAPASGTITANEVKYIIYMYTPLPPQPATIVISH